MLDGTDDFATRFCVNAACVDHGKTLVSGAIGRWTGQVGVFSGRPCYQCLVPDIPPDAETCAAVGPMLGEALARLIRVHHRRMPDSLYDEDGDPLPF